MKLVDHNPYSPVSPDPWEKVSVFGLQQKYFAPLRQNIPGVTDLDLNLAYQQAELAYGGNGHIIDPLLAPTTTLAEKVESLAKETVSKLVTVASPYILRFLVAVDGALAKFDQPESKSPPSPSLPEEITVATGDAEITSPVRAILSSIRQASTDASIYVDAVVSRQKIIESLYESPRCDSDYQAIADAHSQVQQARISSIQHFQSSFETLREFRTTDVIPSGLEAEYAQTVAHLSSDAIAIGITHLKSATTPEEIDQCTLMLADILSQSNGWLKSNGKLHSQAKTALYHMLVSHSQDPTVIQAVIKCGKMLSSNTV